MEFELRSPAVIGVDLDLTLIDTKAATAYALGEVNRHCGAAIDVPAMIERLGPPIRQELGRWIAPDGLDEAVAMFRASFLDGGIERLVPMPGAVELGEAARQNGGGLVVITSRIPPVATACIEAVGIEVAAIAGGFTGVEKADPMREHGVVVYVGDHPLDMQGAIEAGIPGIGVTTGKHTAEELMASGAVCTLDDLHDIASRIH